MNEKEAKQPIPLIKSGVRIPLEDQVSDKKIFAYRPELPKEKREYWHEMAKKDIDRRLKEHAVKTKKFYNLDVNKHKVQMSAMIKMLMKMGLFDEYDFADMFWMCADESVRIIEANVEKDKKEVFNQNLKKKIIVPRGVTPDVKGKARN